MTNFSFNSRETYIAFRVQWKADYKSISAEITDIKRQLRNQPEGQRLLIDQMAALQSKHHYLARRATDMLELRAESKIEAGRQRAERLKTEVANAA